MSGASKKKLVRAIRKVWDEEGKPEHVSRQSSLDADLRAEIVETEEMLEFLRTYRGQHEVLVNMQRTMRRSKGWVPSARDRTLYQAVMRRQRKGQSLSTADAETFALKLGTVDRRPSSLD